MLRMATGFRHRSGLDTRFHICLVPETGTMNPDSVTQAIKQAQVLQPFFFTDTVTVLNSEPSGLSDRLFQKPATQFNFVTRYHGPAAFFHKFRQELGVTGIIGALVMILFISGLYQTCVIWKIR